MDEIYMLEALKEARKAAKHDDVPIGAIIVRNSKIISRAHNEREKKRNVLFHAELLAIQKACKKLRSWRLNDCIMYVTMEPCSMCMGAIEQARITKVVYGTDATKEYMSKVVINKFTNLEEECSTIVKSFFQNKRNK